MTTKFVSCSDISFSFSHVSTGVSNTIARERWGDLGHPRRGDPGHPPSPSPARCVASPASVLGGAKPGPPLC